MKGFGQVAKENDFSSTLNLPKTDFPMRGGLAKSEPVRLAKWNEEGVYELALKKNEGHPSFVLHDGPPYANGPIHIGHAMNKISKDFINRYWTMQGRYVPYIPGWDCHGQPIEHKVETKLGTKKFNETPVEKIREMCNEFAVENIELQKAGFRRLGVLGDWDNPYLTLYHQHDAADIEVFKAMFDRGMVYRGHKPVHWCKHCHTALAEAEIEYSDETSPSIFVRFEMTSKPAGLESFEGPADFIIWTTTPWTIPSDQAISMKPGALYVAVEHDGRAEVMLEALAPKLCEEFGWDYTPVMVDGQPYIQPAETFEGLHYKQPVFDGVEGVALLADYVGVDDGTGIVHNSPGHGVDDYFACLKAGITDICMPVDDDGKFYVGDEFGCGGPFSGMDTDEANPHVIEFLRERGTLVREKKITHSYPHCWRCKNPVLFRATDQWFVSMDKTGLRAEALDEIQNKVTWYPAHAANRIGSMVEQRPDWCISRQRNWGVPIPSYTCQDCGTKVMNDDTLDAVIALFHEKGSDAWFTEDPKSYLGEACVCPKCGGANLKIDRDILDVWWDSGVSWKAVCEYRPELTYPADMYLEGSDQHRGWFQSSLLTSVGANDHAPYRAVISQGFTLDGQGRKMSKSLGNVIDPNKVCDEMGADIIRLWVSSVDTSTDVAIDHEILKRTSDAYRRFRNCFRFLLSELYDFDPATDTVSAEQLLAVDAVALSRMCAVHAKVEEAYAGYRFNQVYRTLYDYVVTELSNVYMDVVKDRTYCCAATSVERRSAQTVLAEILSMLLHDLQPILAFTCDEVLGYLPESMREGQKYAALLDWYHAPMSAEEAAKLAPAWDAADLVRDAVKKALEPVLAQKTIAKSQEARVSVVAPEAVVETVASSGIDMAEFCIVAGVDLVAGEVEEPQAQVEVAQGDKCPRCWNVRTLCEDGLCQRCHEALEG